MIQLALYILLGSAIAMPAAAAECGASGAFKIEGAAKTLCLSRKLLAWMSPECVTGRKGRRCKALGLLEGARGFGPLLSEDRSGGKNPGSVLCAKIGGRVVYATLESGSQVTFCEASDHTLVDCNAIHSAWVVARKKRGD